MDVGCWINVSSKRSNLDTSLSRGGFERTLSGGQGGTSNSEPPGSWARLGRGGIESLSNCVKVLLGAEFWLKEIEQYESLHNRNDYLSRIDPCMMNGGIQEQRAMILLEQFDASSRQSSRHFHLLVRSYNFRCNSLAPTPRRYHEDHKVQIHWHQSFQLGACV